MNEIEKRLKKIELFIESLKSPNTFPKEIKDTLTSLGFLFFDASISYEGGAGGNFFEQIFVKYLNQKKMISVSAIPLTYVVNSLSANTCSLISSNLNLVDMEGQSVALYTSGTFPGGLDLAVWLTMINVTSTTFQLSYDGINPLDITSIGTGTQYLSLM